MKKISKKSLSVVCAGLFAFSGCLGLIDYRCSAIDSPIPSSEYSAEENEFRDERNRTYVLGNPIGRGNQAIVYECKCKDDNKEYVVKIPFDSFDGKEFNENLMPKYKEDVLQVLKNYSMNSVLPSYKTYTTESIQSVERKEHFRPESECKEQIAIMKKKLVLGDDSDSEDDENCDIDDFLNDEQKLESSKDSGELSTPQKNPETPLHKLCTSENVQSVGREENSHPESECKEQIAIMKKKLVLGDDSDSEDDENCDIDDFLNDEQKLESSKDSGELSTPKKNLEKNSADLVFKSESPRNYEPSSKPKPKKAMHVIFNPRTELYLRSGKLRNIIPIQSFHPYIEERMDTTLRQRLECQTYPHTADGYIQWVKMILINVLDTLDSMHTVGICYRDVKPNNIVISDDDKKIYVSDFGSVADFNYSVSHFNGTPAYGAPELLCESGLDKTLIARADVFSVGVMALEMLTNDYKLETFTDMTDAMLHYNEVNPAITERIDQLHMRIGGGHIPTEWQNFLKKCLAKNPIDRFTAREAIEELNKTIIIK